MKKIFRNMLAVMIAAFTVSACEDVPAPYELPSEEGGGGAEEYVYTGAGTLDNPYTCADAIAFAESLGGDESEAEVYIKGKVATVTEAFTTNYGNGTFTISDDGTTANVFTAYRVLYLGNKKFANGDTQIEVGDEVIVCGKVVNYRGNTPETVQGSAYLYSLNGKTGGGGGSSTPGEAKGAGTLADPFNVAGVLGYVNSLGADVTSPNEVYIKGKVVSVKESFSSTYGNATFNIADEGSDAEFYVYRTLYLGNQKYQDGQTQIQVGDEVIVCGKVVNYRGNTPETAQNSSYLYSLNGKTESNGGGGDTPTPSTGAGSKDSPFTVAQAITKCQEVGETATSADFYAKGKIKSIKEVSTSYGNATFDITDDGENAITVYRAYSLGNQKFTSEDEIKVGDEVVVVGKLVNYKGNTPEFTQGCYIYSLNGKTEGGSDTGGTAGGGTTGGGTATSSLTNGDFETWADGLPAGWKSASSASSATLVQSTDAHGGSYSVNVNGNESSNKRLASQEITLAAGTYVFSFYAKATTADAAQVRPGYVPVTNGSVGNYAYGDYANVNNSGWTQVTYEFTLDTESTVCLVVMNPKKSSYSAGKDVLIDDATLTKK